MGKCKEKLFDILLKLTFINYMILLYALLVFALLPVGIIPFFLSNHAEFFSRARSNRANDLTCRAQMSLLFFPPEVRGKG